MLFILVIAVIVRYRIVYRWMVYHVCRILNIYYHFVYKEYLMQDSYSVSLVLLIHITIQYSNVVFELPVSYMCGRAQNLKLWKPVLGINYNQIMFIIVWNAYFDTNCNWAFCVSFTAFYRNHSWILNNLGVLRIELLNILELRILTYSLLELWVANSTNGEKKYQMWRKRFNSGEKKLCISTISQSDLRMQYTDIWNVSVHAYSW
jgi:hypothetical protein